MPEDEEMKPVVQEIQLADAVAAIRDQLSEAAARGKDSDVIFEVGPLELEFTVELRKDAHAHGGIRALVVTAGTDAEAGRTRTHRVCVTLQPGTRTGGRLRISADGWPDPSPLTAVGES